MNSKCKGYVRNKTAIPLYVLKRFVNPGSKIDMKIICDRYYDESGAQDMKQFVDWLKTTIFSDSTTWEIYVGTDEDNFTEYSSKATPNRAHVITNNYSSKVEELDPKQMLRMSSKKLEKALENYKDVKILKQVLAKAMTMSRKQKVCRVLRNRIEELSI